MSDFLATVLLVLCLWILYDPQEAGRVLGHHLGGFQEAFQENYSR